MKIEKIDYIKIFISLIFVLTYIYFLSLLDFLVILLMFFIYWNIIFLIHLLWSKLRKKEFKKYWVFIPYIFFRFILLFIIIWAWLWSFAYYQNEVSPAKMPVYTISNWDKTIIFQNMSHIWTQSFYHNVKENIIKSKNKDFVLYYEWVKPWKEENMQEFNKILWIDFNQDTYKNFSKLYWLTHQDNRLFLNLVNNKDYNIDISIDDIISIYKEKTESKEIKNKKSKSEEKPININKLVNEKLENLNERQLKILVYINQSIMNFIIKNKNFRDGLLKYSWKENLFEVILWERNNHLSDAIINRKDKKVHILYWLMHFPWVFENLKNSDPNWKIIKTEYLQIIE